MRRSDREIKEYNAILDIIEKCQVCRIGLYDAAQDETYIVPLNYGYHDENGKLSIYFHGAKCGRKYELILSRPKGCIEFDCNHEIISNEIACRFTSNWKSVIGNGTITILTDPVEKFQAMNCIMNHYTGNNDWMFQKQILNQTVLYKFSIEKISGKEHIS